MNCNEFLPKLESGGAIGRWRARRHAARCPRCAAVYTALQAATEELSAVEPLSQHARELWMRAARESAPVPIRAMRWLPAVACLATAACVLVMVRWEIWPPNGPRIGGVTHDPH